MFTTVKRLDLEKINSKVVKVIGHRVVVEMLHPLSQEEFRLANY